jgi:hypothetical protein
LPPDLPKDLEFDLNSYSWITFGMLDFDLRHRAGYLSKLRFFKCELLNALTDDDEEAASNKDRNDHEDEGFDDGGAAWDPEHQPPDLTKDEAIQLTIDQSELGQLTKWNNLGFQFRKSGCR